MSRATKKLEKACDKLEGELLDAHYLLADCGLPAVVLSQEDYNWEVDLHEGDELKAKKALRKHYNADLKTVIKDLTGLGQAAEAVIAALPAVAEEQLARLDAMEYTGEDGLDDI